METEFFDSHAHYNDEKFAEDREDVIEKIYESGVTKFVSAGYDVESSIYGLKLAYEKEYIYTTVGVSPNDVKESIEETEIEIKKIEEILKSEIENKKIVAIGEIGLDYYWNKENKEIQKYAFIEQIKLANKYNLPIVIHTREAVMDTLDILKNVQAANKKGIFHCCPLNRELVKEALKLDFYISFAGPVTFKNAKNAEEIVQMVPLEKALIETDSPYLTPEPKRGTRNDSRNVKLIAQKIADFKGITIEEVAKATYKNAMKIFNIK
ncbi:MAG: TatD family hydrolase [Clostridia bacterium]